MKKNPGKTAKKPEVPMRTCCGCRQSFPKKTLVRIVRTPEGSVELDVTGRRNGRGAYLCRNAACLRRAEKSGSIARSLDTRIDRELFDKLEKELEGFEA